MRGGNKHQNNPGKNECRNLRAKIRGICAINGRDKRGFTLIEVMVSLLMLAFGLLASIIGIMAALDYSLMDEMRNDAMKIAQEQQEAARNMHYKPSSNFPTGQMSANYEAGEKKTGHLYGILQPAQVLRPAQVWEGA